MSQINQYINAHLQWITKLTAVIYGGQVPDWKTAGLDNVCDLGKWIYSEGSTTCGHLNEFTELREKHKLFHSTVGEIIDLVQAGKTEEAKAGLTSDRFRQTSADVVNLLSKLRKMIH